MPFEEAGFPCLGAIERITTGRAGATVIHAAATIQAAGMIAQDNRPAIGRAADYPAMRVGCAVDGVLRSVNDVPGAVCGVHRLWCAGRIDFALPLVSAECPWQCRPPSSAGA